MLAALVLSAGPGNAQSFQQVSPPSAPWPEPVVYAALTSRGVVNVYRDKDTRPKHPIFTFGLDPGTESSLVVDQKGNLFLADPFSTWVYEYAPGASAPTKSFPTSQTPFNIALFGNTLYVFQSMPSGGGASIAIYGHGSTSPTRSLSNPAIVFPQGMAVDGAGNVFVAYGGATLGKYGVGEFAAGRMPMKRIKIPHSIFPVALGIDPSGNLLVDGAGNQAGQSTLFIFPPGQIVPSGSLAMPSLYQFSFTADGTSMYVGDVGDRSFRKYSYPSGTLIYRKKDQDARWGFSGIAASPAPSVGVW
ncbi:MAG: hypothetical protein WDN04_23430 [Rhodospirillales bacterium]